MLLKCFNGILGDFRKIWKNSEIITLQPYLHPAEKNNSNNKITKTEKPPQVKWLPSMGGCTVNAVAVTGTFPPGMRRAGEIPACSQTCRQGPHSSASAGAALSPSLHIHILSVKAFYGCIPSYFARLSCASCPLAEDRPTAADPQWVCLNYPPHACHQQITQENMEKGYIKLLFV